MVAGIRPLEIKGSPDYKGFIRFFIRVFRGQCFCLCRSPSAARHLLQAVAAVKRDSAPNRHPVNVLAFSEGKDKRGANILSATAGRSLTIPAFSM
jgi:hypothetical protein